MEEWLCSKRTVFNTRLTCRLESSSLVPNARALDEKWTNETIVLHGAQQWNICVCAASREVFYLRHSGPHSHDLTFAPAPPKPTNQQKHEFWPKSKLAGVELAKVEQAEVEQIRMAKVESFAIHLGVPDLVCASNTSCFSDGKHCHSKSHQIVHVFCDRPKHRRAPQPCTVLFVQLLQLFSNCDSFTLYRFASFHNARLHLVLLSQHLPFCFGHDAVPLSTFSKSSSCPFSRLQRHRKNLRSRYPVLPETGCSTDQLQKSPTWVAIRGVFCGIHVHLRRFFKQLFSFRPDRCQWPDLIFVESQCAHCAHWHLPWNLSFLHLCHQVFTRWSRLGQHQRKSLSPMEYRLGFLDCSVNLVLKGGPWVILWQGFTFMFLSWTGWRSQFFLYASPWEWAIADVGGYSKAVLPRYCLWC